MAAVEFSATLAYPETATQRIFSGASNDPDARTAGITAATKVLGCDSGQGYLLARPMPAGQVESWMWAKALLPVGVTF
jgi:hypothetical protein